MSRLIKWGDYELSAFYRTWPCCDVPQSGWALFDDNGDLIEISNNVSNCQQGGGLPEFLDDLKKD